MEVANGSSNWLLKSGFAIALPIRCCGQLPDGAESRTATSGTRKHCGEQVSVAATSLKRSQPTATSQRVQSFAEVMVMVSAWLATRCISRLKVPQATEADHQLHSVRIGWRGVLRSEVKEEEWAASPFRGTRAEQSAPTA